MNMPIPAINEAIKYINKWNEAQKQKPMGHKHLKGLSKHG